MPTSLAANALIDRRRVQVVQENLMPEKKNSFDPCKSSDYPLTMLKLHSKFLPSHMSFYIHISGKSLKSKSNLVMETCSLFVTLLSAQECQWETTRHLPSRVQSCQPTEGPVGQRKPGPPGPRRGPLPIPKESASQGSATIW